MDINLGISAHVINGPKICVPLWLIRLVWIVHCIIFWPYWPPFLSLRSDVKRFFILGLTGRYFFLDGYRRWTATTGFINLLIRIGAMWYWIRLFWNLSIMVRLGDWIYLRELHIIDLRSVLVPSKFSYLAPLSTFTDNNVLFTSFSFIFVRYHID